MVGLKLEIRDIKGKKVKKARKQGKIPAVVYGPEIETRPVFVDEKELQRVFKEAGGSTLVDLHIEGEEKSIKAFIYDWQKDPLTERFLHVDFYSPKLTEKVEVEVPVVLKGEAPALKKGGNMLLLLDELEVRALPHLIPHEIEIDVSVLEEIDQEIKVGDLELPPELEVLREPDEVIVKVVEAGTQIQEEPSEGLSDTLETESSSTQEQPRENEPSS